MARLENKVALISGGARGMGAAEARIFAREGAKVVIGDVLEEEGLAGQGLSDAGGTESKDRGIGCATRCRPIPAGGPGRHSSNDGGGA